MSQNTVCASIRMDDKLTRELNVSQAVLAGGSGVHVMTKLVTFPAADNGLCFLTLSVNLSNKAEVRGRM